MWASQNGHLAIVEYLVTQGAQVGQATQRGGTASMLAWRNGHLACVEHLLLQGAPVQQADGDGLTALIQASCSGHLWPLWSTWPRPGPTAHDFCRARR